MKKSGEAFIGQSNFSTKLQSGNYNTADSAGLPKLIEFSTCTKKMLGNTLDCFPLSNTECYDLIKNKGNEIFEYDFIKSLAPM